MKALSFFVPYTALEIEGCLDLAQPERYIHCFPTLLARIAYNQTTIREGNFMIGLSALAWTIELTRSHLNLLPQDLRVRPRWFRDSDV
jgi:hypothetical protein